MRFAITSMTFSRFFFDGVASKAAGRLKGTTDRKVRADSPLRLVGETNAAPGDKPMPIVLTYDTPPAIKPARRGVRVCRSSAENGRMVISGRMEDVCAELARLAQCEATST